MVIIQMKKTKEELMKEYGIKSVGAGTFRDGFFSCLRGIDERNIDLFSNTHVIKTIRFAQRNKLTYSWLINQLKDDARRGIGKPLVKG